MMKKIQNLDHNQIIVLFYWVGYAFSIIRSKSSMSQKLIELKRDCYFYYTYPIVSKGRVNKSGPILPPLGYSLQGKKRRERTQRNKLFTKKRERRDVSISFSSPWKVVMAANRLQIQGDESVLLRVTHSNLKTFSADIRFSLQVQTKTKPNSHFSSTLSH